MKEKRQSWLIILWRIFLFLCVFIVIGSIDFTKDGFFFVLPLGVTLASLMYYSLNSSLRLKKLEEIKRCEEENYIFKFSKEPTSRFHVGLARREYNSLAYLVKDYGLSDCQVDLIVEAGIRDAVYKYRQEHPLKDMHD